MSQLRIYDKQTAASRGKQVNRGDTQSPDEKAVSNRHNPGWFARPEKFTNERPSTNSLGRSQRGMNRSNGRSNDGQGQSTRKTLDEKLFDDEDYKQMVESDSGNLLRPESPYSIPEQAKFDSADYMHRQAEHYNDEMAEERRDTPGF